jgi:TonB-linked SusC/RagA family outer membrane protein
MKKLTLLMRLSMTVLFAFVSMGISYAQMKVNGQVVDQSGEPVIGANVVEKGTTNGIITDLDGNFTLEVKRGATLIISFVGYVTQEVKAAAQVKVVMAEDSELLEDLVVVGYGVQKKSSVTGSISSVKTEDVANRTITNAQSALQGKTAGVQVVTTSGVPGSAPAIRVRGYSSNSDMSPLYVVDGIIMSDISSIEPNDIESMEVLKDAASAAIYGAQAGNGVVLITTKKGAKGNEGWGQVSYDFQLSNESLGSTPNLMNAKQYAEYMVEANIFSEGTVKSLWDGKSSTDWVNAVYDKSTMMKHNLTFSNGSDKGSVYVSGSYLTNNGIAVGDIDMYKRLNGVINVEYKIKPWLKISGNANMAQTTRRPVDGSAFGAAFTMDPLTSVAYDQANMPDNMKSALALGYTLLQNDKGQYYGVSNFNSSMNPFISLYNTETKENAFTAIGNFAVDVTLAKGLTFTSKFGFTNISLDRNSYENDYFGGGYHYRDFAAMSQTNSNSKYYQWDNYVNYMTTIAKKHDVTAMVGHSFTKNNYVFTTGGLTANGEDALIKDDPELFGWLDFAAGSATRTNAGLRTISTSESYFGRLTYAYDGKYMAQFSLRADAFDLSKLPLTNRWGYFPAASVAWVASNEGFWKIMPEEFSYLKIRASWGKNGSVGPLSGYAYATTMSTNGNYDFGTPAANNRVPATTPATMGNDKLTWETSTQLDFGLDARLFRDRLTFSMDWYKKKTDNLLISGATPSLIAGGAFSPLNAGSVENKGFEFELGWRDQIGKDFTYGIRGNLSTLKNKVTYLTKGLPYITGYKPLSDPLTIFKEGNEVWNFYGYRFAGVRESDGAALFYNQAGEITDTPNMDDRTNIGSAIPNITYGITLNAAYKGFDLLIFGNGTSGSKIYQALFRSDSQNDNRLADVWYNDRWSPTNTHASHPAANANIASYMVSDAMVFSGDYFRIKQIQLGYTLPKALLNKIKINNLRLYISLDDWFTFTKYCGFDPESASVSTGSGQGVDTGTYPISKKMVCGLNLTF